MNKKILLTLVAVVATFTAMAQGRMDMCINEVMVQNGSCADQNGKCQAWVELFNASYGTNAIEKMFITTFKQDYIQNYFKKMESKSNKKRNVLLEELRDQYPDKVYEIPRGDVDTKIKPRTHVVFYADGDTTAGTLHLSFTLTPASDNYIALYDVNGDLVDEVIVPANLQAGQSFARKSEGLPSDMHKGGNHSFDAAQWEMRDGTTIAKAITPGKFNVRPVNENIEKFKNEDPSGILLTIMSMGVVFLACCCSTSSSSSLARRSWPARIRKMTSQQQRLQLPSLLLKLATTMRQSLPCAWPSTSTSTLTTRKAACSPSTTATRLTALGARRATCCSTCPSATIIINH